MMGPSVQLPAIARCTSEEFLQPMGLSQHRLALAVGGSARRINEIVLGKRGISADTALRLSAYFGNSADFCMGIQMDYDLDTARIDTGDRWPALDIDLVVEST